MKTESGNFFKNRKNTVYNEHPVQARGEVLTKGENKVLCTWIVLHLQACKVLVLPECQAKERQDETNSDGLVN